MEGDAKPFVFDDFLATFALGRGGVMYECKT